ncbi:MAG: SAM-dependent chlorinase/fluorinase [Azospirillaceae bacterium]|nr:SAM-dependent chlorinase/fluorinase [Azospirillaceae bacterium]
MIFLFTDFGVAGPYLGQVRAVLALAAPGIPVIDLFADLPPWRIQPAAYLLGAYAPALPPGSLVLGVVDPGVGTERRPVVVEADGRSFVGPDNGLFAPLVRRAARAMAHHVTWAPAQLSVSFHGRDLFAPIAARRARGEAVPGVPIAPETLDRPSWPDDLAEIIYIDVYGNAMTGLRASTVAPDAVLRVGTTAVPPARVFGAVPPGALFWYANSNGLAEIAANQGRAATILGLSVGDPVVLVAGAVP